MPVKTPPLDLGQRIQRLVDERQQHLAAVAEINQTLSRIKDALQPAPTSSAMLTSIVTGKTRRRKMGHFAMTGEESVLAFIKQNKNPTSQEIEKHWKSEGRGGAAANPLTKLVNEKTIKRTPLKEGRGSRYTLA